MILEGGEAIAANKINCLGNNKTKFFQQLKCVQSMDNLWLEYLEKPLFEMCCFYMGRRSEGLFERFVHFLAPFGNVKKRDGVNTDPIKFSMVPV